MGYDSEMCVYNTVTIATGEKESTAIKIAHYKWFAIYLPGNWVTGKISFKSSLTKDGLYLPVVYSDVSAVEIASIAASKCIVLSGAILNALLALPYIKLVAENAQTTNDKVITIVMKR